jgi:hypothetical protein
VHAILTLLYGVHGAIHLLGFLKWEKLAKLPQLSGVTVVPLSAAGQRIFALGWLLSCLLLVIVAGLRALRWESWWGFALVGIALSETVIVLSWSDARFGTVLNVLLLLPALAAAGHARLTQRIDAEVSELSAEAQRPAGSPVRAEDLAALPEPVRRWLDAAGVVGKPPACTVRLTQQGQLRTQPDGPWMAATASQFFTVEPPAFIWQVDTGLYGVLPISGRDRLRHGRGEMEIKAASLVNLVHARGDAIDQGSLLRFLGELVWFPSAALSPYLEWEPIDDGRARATFRQGAASVSATFEFNESGQFVRLSAHRYLGGEADASLMPWTVTAHAWARWQGIEVPSRGEVTWELPAGPFTYYRWQIDALAFDAEVTNEPWRLKEARSQGRARLALAGRGEIATYLRARWLPK